MIKFYNEENCNNIYVGFVDTSFDIEIGINKKLNKFDLGCFFEFEDSLTESVDLKTIIGNTNKIVREFNALMFVDLVYNNSAHDAIELVYTFFDNVRSKVFDGANFTKNSILYDYFYYQVNSNIQLITAFDMTIIILASIIYDLKHTDTICFNLPAGAGKTFHIDWLYRLLSDCMSVRVACPTAKACVHFKSAGARTVHSSFMINPITNKSQEKTHHIKDSVVILDECSMISPDIITTVLSLLDYTTFLFLIGDFSQLKPVKRESLWCLVEKSWLIRREYPRIKFFHADNFAFFLPRFEDPELLKLTQYIRYRILEPRNFKHSMHTFKHEIDSLFAKIVHSNESETYFDRCVETHKNICEILSNNDNYFMLDDVIQNPPLVTSKNATNAKNLSTFFGMVNCEGYLKSNLILDSALLRLIQTNNYIEKEFDNYLREINCPIGQVEYKFGKGCFVVFKKNVPPLVNGDVGIIVDILLPDNYFYVDVKIRGKLRRLCVCDDKKPKLRVYLMRTKMIIDSPLIILELPDSRIKFCTFYLMPFYSMTIYQLQGFTISRDSIQAQDDLLDLDILKSGYVFISRCKYFYNFLMPTHCIKKLYNQIFK
jgi:hypothetical protein